jgi:hypothetical protein
MDYRYRVPVPALESSKLFEYSLNVRPWEANTAMEVEEGSLDLKSEALTSTT